MQGNGQREAILDPDFDRWLIERVGRDKLYLLRPRDLEYLWREFRPIRKKFRESEKQKQRIQRRLSGELLAGAGEKLFFASRKDICHDSSPILSFRPSTPTEDEEEKTDFVLYLRDGEVLRIQLKSFLYSGCVESFKKTGISQGRSCAKPRWECVLDAHQRPGRKTNCAFAWIAFGVIPVAVAARDNSPRIIKERLLLAIQEYREVRLLLGLPSITNPIYT